jgi:hypothetical protein
MPEGRVVDRRLSLAQIGPVFLERDASAVAVRLQHGLQRSDRSDQKLSQRDDIVQAAAIDQRFHVTRRQGEAAHPGPVVCVLDLENACHCLLFEPLTDVPLVGVCPLGQLL